MHLFFALLLSLLVTATSNSQIWNASSQQRPLSFPTSTNTNASDTNQHSDDNKALINNSSNTTLQAVDASSLRQSSLLHSDGASKEHEYSCSHPWFYRKNSSNGSTVCECGSRIGHTVQCPTECQQLQVLVCYCMTYNKETASYVVGMCFYACFFTSTYYPIPRRVNATNHNAFVCKRYRYTLHFHRDGQLCGACEDGYAPPAYSYSLACVKCSNYSKNWIKYILAAFLPLTLFFWVIIVFRLSATTGLLNDFVFVAQILTFPAQLRMLTTLLSVSNTSTTIVFLSRFVFSLYSCWNLDFFRTVYTPFCLHPKLTTIQTLAMDYLIAVYPLALLGLVYLLVELHDRGCRPVVWLWKPFHYCFTRFRRQWNIKTSLIDSFATFLFLSFLKFLSVSVDLLVPTTVYNIHGERLSKIYLYYDGSIEFFGREHLPFGIMALLVFLVFNLFPTMLLCLYPCGCFQRCLNKLGLRCDKLHILMDSFQGCYKDGTNGTHDCRYFAGLYLWIRIVLIGIYALTRTNFYYPPATVAVAVFGILFALFQPYKIAAHNTIGSFFIFLLVVCYSSGMAIIISSAQTVVQSFRDISKVMIAMSYVVPLFYIVGVAVYRGVVREKLPQKCFRRMIHRNTREQQQPLVDSLPDRIVHPEEYELSRDPCSEYQLQ